MTDPVTAADCAEPWPRAVWRLAVEFAYGPASGRPPTLKEGLPHLESIESEAS